MAWICLLLAGLLEILWAAMLKQSAGFSKLGPSVVTVIAMLGSIGLLALAMKVLPLGTAYAVWTGIGAVGAFLVGIFLLGEAVTPLRLASAALLVLGLIGLKISAPS